MRQTLDPAQTPETTWNRLLERLGNRWRRAGRERHWLIEESNFKHSVRDFQARVPAHRLFTSGECSKRRHLLREELRRNFITRMTQELRLSWWRKLTSRRIDNIDRLKALYIRHGRGTDFERQHIVYVRQRNEVDTLPVEALFSPKERSASAYRHTRPMRKQFAKWQQVVLRKYRTYDKLVAGLPTDEIDQQMQRLEDDYSYVGREREWCREFDKLVDSVMEDSMQDSEGVNESRIRLLQNDFLLTMRGRLPAYWRYFQLRGRSYDQGISELIRRFSYFEQHLVTLHVEGRDTTECYTELEKFTRKIQNILTHEQRRQYKRQRIDHTRRMSEWDSIRHHFDEPVTNVVSTFARLKPILKTSPEWIHELNVFNAMLLVRRDMDGRRKNSPEELDEIRQFINRMVERIDDEIATDTAFQALEQELMQEGKHLDDLQAVLRRIAVARRSNSAQAADDINNIKQEFIRSIWEQRTVDQEGASVTPLFANNRGGRFREKSPGSGRQG